MTGTWIGIIVGVIAMVCGFGEMYWSQAHAFNFRLDKKWWLYHGLGFFLSGYVVVVVSAFGAFA